MLTDGMHPRLSSAVVVPDRGSLVTDLPMATKIRSVGDVPVREAPNRSGVQHESYNWWF